MATKDGEMGIELRRSVKGDFAVSTGEMEHGARNGEEGRLGGASEMLRPRRDTGGEEKGKGKEGDLRVRRLKTFTNMQIPTRQPVRVKCKEWESRQALRPGENGTNPSQVWRGF